MNFRIVDVKQGTPEWHEWRAGGIGASLAPVIMGDSPYQTALELAEEMKGLRPARAPNPAMRLGSRLEAKVLDLIKPVMGAEFLPGLCAEHNVTPQIRASFDAVEVGFERFCEIKMVGKAALEEVKRTDRPLKHHLAQLAQQAYVLGSLHYIYVAFTADSDGTLTGLYIVVGELDQGYVDLVSSEVLKFYEEVVIKSELPSVGSRDTVELPECPEYRDYVRAHDSFARAKAALEDAKARLIAYVGDVRNARISNLKIQTVTRKGSVNYAAIPELKGLDLDPYRGPATEFKQIRGINED